MKLLKIFFLLTILPTVLLAQDMKCPENGEIWPCKCFNGYVECTGSTITQEIVQRTVDIIRRHNDLGLSDILNITEFAVSGTSMRGFDLTPFLNVAALAINIFQNFNLTSIYGPGETYYNLIDVRTLSLELNSLDDQGLGDTLKYFTPSMKQLVLDHNLLMGPIRIENQNGFEFESEFLPGLGSLTQLEILYLHNNLIGTIGDSPFAQNNRLTNLWLTGNRNLSIEASAFYLNDSFISTEILNVHLELCDLDDDSINNQENGLMELQRPLWLFLANNQFEFVSADNFETLLRADDSNRLYLEWNDLICDSRMKWLHDQKEIFQSKVFNADCANDVGFDVFTTSLIQ